MLMLRTYYADEDDEKIVGIANPNLSVEQCKAHPAYASWFAKWSADRDGHWQSTHENYAAEAFRDEIEENNRRLRWLYRAALAVEKATRTRHGRHGELVLSSAFNANHPAVQALARYEADPSRPLAVLSGPPGTGKTTAAVWWALHHAKQNRDPGLPEWITAAAFGRSSRYDDGREKLLNSSALVLDDAGAEYADAKGSLRTDIDELVDTFYRRGRRLVITTNLDAKGFEERYGARVTDRMAEAGVWIPVVGESMRRKAP